MAWHGMAWHGMAWHGMHACIRVCMRVWHANACHAACMHVCHACCMRGNDFVALKNKTGPNMDLRTCRRARSASPPRPIPFIARSVGMSRGLDWPLNWPLEWPLNWPGCWPDWPLGLEPCPRSASEKRSFIKSSTLPWYCPRVTWVKIFGYLAIL